jgi:hypothetical protein
MDATVAVTRKVLVAVVAPAGMEAGPSARNPTIAAESANFTAFRNFTWDLFLQG